MRLPLEVLKALGAEELILTNAAGSLRDGMGPNGPGTIETVQPQT